MDETEQGNLLFKLVTNDMGKILYANDTFHYQLCIRLSKIYYTNIYDYIHPEDHILLGKAIRKVCQIQTYIPIRFRFWNLHHFMTMVGRVQIRKVLGDSQPRIEIFLETDDSLVDCQKFDPDEMEIQELNAWISAKRKTKCQGKSCEL